MMSIWGQRSKYYCANSKAVKGRKSREPTKFDAVDVHVRGVISRDRIGYAIGSMERSSRGEAREPEVQVCLGPYAKSHGRTDSMGSVMVSSLMVVCHRYFHLRRIILVLSSRCSSPLALENFQTEFFASIMRHQASGALKNYLPNFISFNPRDLHR